MDDTRLRRDPHLQDLAQKVCQQIEVRFPQAIGDFGDLLADLDPEPWSYGQARLLGGLAPGVQAFLVSLSQIPMSPIHLQCMTSAVQIMGSVRYVRPRLVRHRQVRLAPAASPGVIEAEERLRQEIAEELHGSVQTKLFLVWHKLIECEKQVAQYSPTLAAQMDGLAQSLDDVREKDVRKLSHRLHPGMIRVALRPALYQLIQPYREYMCVQLIEDPQFVALDSPLNNGISQNLRLALYRVAEEALSNARHHGQARQVTIRLDVEAGRVKLIVADDGVGFAPQAVPHGLGWELMTERVQALGGTLEISSAPGLGTQLRAWIPLSPVCQPAIHAQAVEII